MVLLTLTMVLSSLVRLPCKNHEMYFLGDSEINKINNKDQSTQHYDNEHII